ncbi:nuclear transport factor 2 family protein [Nocardioides daejeonensis]|uniref:nuclear transport factor 2 family protein n=1 Tax=Nocardioides daejeonensis TaxID=1046556 RepID=UPI000D745F2B|nr:nuclear transport factor 2 family protein [Nocardioides daejeonensis]
MDAATHIANLLYRYAELLDSGDLEGTAALFAKARLRMGGGRVLEGAEPILAMWRANVRIHEDGTPRTKHVITNPIIEVDDEAGRATCRSYYTVFQATETLPLQPVAQGRYHDTFVCDGGQWRFEERDYSLFDAAGDLSQHLLRAPRS